MIILDRLRWISRAWRYRLLIERNEIEFLINNLKPGQVAVDIGAHKGAYTYWMSKCVGKNGKVYSFEPQPILYKKMRDLFESSTIGNVNLYPIAFSSFIGKADLIIPSGKSSPSASIDRVRESRSTIIEINTTTLDEFFCNKNNISVDYIKCDAEGHELDIFENAKQLFSCSRPIISVESEARHCGEKKVLDLFSFFEDKGYKGYFFNEDKIDSIKNFSINYYQLNPSKKIYINNFIFLRK